MYGLLCTAEAGSAWHDDMRQTIADINLLLEKQSDFLEWLDDMQPAFNAQDALDVMEALGDALHTHSSCDEFLLEAIAVMQ